MEKKNSISVFTSRNQMRTDQNLQHQLQKLTVMTKKVFRSFPPQTDVPSWWEAE
jgi:hypothetical protein